MGLLALPDAGSGATAIAVTGRALAAAGALVVVGLAAFPLLVVLPARRRLADRTGVLLLEVACRRLRRPLVVSAAVAVAGTLLVLVDTTAGTGPLLLARVAALVLVTALLTTRPGGRVRTGPRLVGCLTAGVLALLTFSLSSHAAGATADRPVAVAFDAVHLVAAGVWTGGLLGLALAGLPAAHQVGGRDRATVGDAAAALARGFSVVATLALLAVFATGGYAALLQVSALSDLGSTSWGVELTVKLALFATVLLFAAANAVTFVPAVAGRAAATGRRLAAADDLRSAVRVEIALAGALIVVAALMSASAPPAQLPDRLDLAAAAAAGTTHTTTARGSRDGYVVTVRVLHSGTGAAAATVFRVDLTTEDTPASAPSADALLRGSDGVDRRVPLTLRGAGSWTSDRLAVAPGRYRLTARFDRQDGRVVVPVTVEVPA